MANTCRTGREPASEHLGVDVPGSPSVIGFDDILVADFCNPPLTTVASPPKQAGWDMIDLLLGTYPAGPGGAALRPAGADSTGRRTAR